MLERSLGRLCKKIACYNNTADGVSDMIESVERFGCIFKPSCPCENIPIEVPIMSNITIQKQQLLIKMSYKYSTSIILVRKSSSIVETWFEWTFGNADLMELPKMSLSTQNDTKQNMILDSSRFRPSRIFKKKHPLIETDLFLECPHLNNWRGDVAVEIVVSSKRFYVDMQMIRSERRYPMKILKRFKFKHSELESFILDKAAESKESNAKIEKRSAHPNDEIKIHWPKQLCVSSGFMRHYKLVAEIPKDVGLMEVDCADAMLLWINLNRTIQIIQSEVPPWIDPSAIVIIEASRIPIYISLSNLVYRSSSPQQTALLINMITSECRVDSFDEDLTAWERILRVISMNPLRSKQAVEQGQSIREAINILR